MEQLQIMTYVNGVDDKPFLDEENPIYITDFTFTAQRMGGVSMTATIMHPQCLDKYWTGKEFVTFRGEKYFVFDTPSSSKNNEDERYKHEITFLSERSILENTYFYDVVTSDTENDKPVSNSTNVVFYGDIAEFAERLNKSLEYSGVEYTVVLDEGISSEPKLISFKDMFFFNVLQEMFSIYEIPFYFVGKTIHIGFTENAITEPFRYGIDYQLLGVNKSNANFRIVTRCTGTGSSDNIPYYYPNNSPKGDIQVVTPFTNQGITAEDIIITDYDKFSREVQLGEEVRYFSPAVKNIRKYTIDSDGGNEQPYSGAKIPVNQIENMMYGETYFRVRFTAQDTGTATIGFILTEDDVNPNTRVLIADAVAFMGADSTPYSENMTVKNDSVSLYLEKDTEYYLDLTVSVIFERLSGVLDSCNVTLEEKAQAENIWMLGEKQIELSEIGIRIDGTPAIGDFFVQEKTGYINPQQNLMPSIYRQTKGAERFYNAVNDKYPIPDTDPVEYYEFKNQYTELNPREHTQSFEYIKPTIQGMKNAAGQLLGIFKEVAFDAEDNDDVDDEGNYIHPYFFVKLNKFNGTHGFNLFDQASESGAMTISMTTGSCGACQFEIGVGEETQKNIVQVDGSGNLMRDDSGNVIRSGKPQERQNDTVNYEVWLALKKDTSTYGVVMPNATNNYKPKAGDEFVILNINLPQSYILAAEDRLTEAIIKYMSQNNDEKFNFSIDVSRIYIAENKEVADKINENARINLIYNIQDEEPVPEALYISQFTYTQKEGDALPSIQLQLEKEISVHTNSVKSSISAVKQDIMNSIGSIDFLKIGLKYFLRKDVDDYARGKIDFLKGFDIGNFVAGRLGIGGRAEVTEDGSSKLTIDFLEVRRKAIFNEITIQELKHIGGQIILSPAAMVCSDVEEKPDRYRCFFNREDKDGSVIFNEFVVGDQAIKQTFNLEETGYYWRLVIGIGDDYIDLSKKDADSGSDAPQPGDNIVQLGNRTDIERQSAQILSAFGENSPSHIFYKGIDSYTLAGKEIVGTEYDKAENEPRFFCYGSGHIGDKDMAASDSTYVSFSKGEGESKKSLKIKGKVTITGGSSGLDNFDEWKDKQDQIDNATQDAQEAKEAAQNAQQSVSDLEGKFDDIVSDGFVTEAEAIAIQKYVNQINSAYSAVQSTYTQLYENIYLPYDNKTALKSAYDKLTASKDDLIQTINNVISDGKATQEEVALVDTKFAAYNQNTQEFYKQVEMSKQAIETALKNYTDEKVGEAQAAADAALDAANTANEAVANLNSYIDGAFNDGIITEAEAIAIGKYISQVNESFNSLSAKYSELHNNTYLDGLAKTNLEDKYAALTTKKDNLISKINIAIEDGKATQEESTAVDTAYSEYIDTVSDFNSAIEIANKAIQDKLKGFSDDALQQSTEANLAAQEALESANKAKEDVANLNNYIDGAFSDGIISESEAIAIAKYINQINESFATVEATYNVLYQNANLSGKPKTNLKSAYDALSASKTSLINIINTVISDSKATKDEVAQVDTKFADYNAKTKVFYQRVEEANDAIRKAIEEIANQALTAAGEAKQDAADAIQAANESKQAVSDLENTVNGSFKDGIITEAEAKAIEKYINLVNESFGDLEAAYNEIYANPYLVDESAKNGLQTAFTGLSQKKDALISAINTAIADGKTTTNEAKAVDTAFEAYNTAVAAFQTAVENANKAIQTYLKGISDAAYEAANQAIQQATEMQQRLDGWAADDVISPAEKESLKNLENQTLAEYFQIYQEANFWEMTQPSNPHYSKWEAYETAYDNIIAALAKYTAKEPENIPIEDDYGDIQKYYDAKAQILAAIAYVSRERFDDIDKTTEELTAKTKGFTVIDGGLIYSQILNLTEVVGNVSAGASGISKDTEGNPLPAFWAGGTYAEAKGDDSVFVVRHDGSAKFGQVHLDPLGRVVVYEDIPWDWVEAQESVIITSESIPTLDEIAETNINKTVQNTAQTINITTSTVNYKQLTNKVTVEYEGATIAVNTTIKAEYNIFSSQSKPTLKAGLTLYLAKDGEPMYELGKVSVDSTDLSSITPATLLIDNVTNKVPKGTYSLWMAYSAIREGANTLDTLKVSIEASTMTYKYNFSSTQFIIGNGGFVLKASAFNFLRATYTGLTAKYASGYVDMPGVLVAGRVFNSINGIVPSIWGAKANGITITSSTAGSFMVKHNFGHTDYYVQITTEEMGFAYVGARNSTSFYVYTKDKAGAAKAMSFQFAVFGDNR